MTLREIVYLILDELHLGSDDSNFNEDHIKFLCKNYRTFLLKQRYSDLRKQIPSSNYQTISLDLEVVPSVEGLECGNKSLKSIKPIPNLMTIGNINVYPTDYTNYRIAYISKDRMKFVGYNSWLKNIIYCSNINDYLYFKSNNPQHIYLNKVKLTGIFEDCEEAAILNNNIEDGLDIEFPLESALIPQLIQLVVQDLSPKTISPEDSENNATDDKANLANYLARNTKSNLAKQIS